MPHAAGPGNPDEFEMNPTRSPDDAERLWGDPEDDVEVEIQPVSDEEFLEDVEAEERHMEDDDD